MKALLMIVASLALLWGCSKDRQRQGNVEVPSRKQPTFSSAGQAANAALSTLKKLANSENYNNLGFQTPAEVKNASLGSPAKVYVIPTDKLAQYKPGMNVRSLFSDIHRTVFPVVVNGNAKTLITVQQTPEGWSFVSYGDNTLADNLQRVRSHKINQTGSGPGAGPEGYFDLRVQ